MVSRIVASINNPDSFRHTKTYIEPIIGIENGGRLSTAFKPFEKNEVVTIHDYTVVQDKICVVITSDQCYLPTFVPISRLAKFKNPEDNHLNRGIAYETEVINSLNEFGLMEGDGAGCRDGVDGYLKKEDGSLLSLELKRDKKCLGGQGVLHHIDGLWNVSERFVAATPLLAKCVTDATITIDGQSTNLLNALNMAVPGPDVSDEFRKVSLHSDVTDLTPFNAYLKDKKADIVHFGDKGTFGVSDATDLPKPTGRCKIRIRKKHPATKSLSAQVEILSIDQSPVKFDFFSSSGTEKIKTEYLGYGSTKVSSNTA